MDNTLPRPGTGIAGGPSGCARESQLKDEEDSVISKATTMLTLALPGVRAEALT